MLSLKIFCEGLLQLFITDKCLLFVFLQPIQFKSYLDMFPFPFYLVLKEIKSMPAVLGDALQQWFQLINDGHFITV